MFPSGAAVLLVPSLRCDPISVCVEDDEDLRVDCQIKPRPSQINSYEFSWSSGSKETLINTNVSGSTTEPRFRESSYVEELQPYGYRLTLTGYTHTLPYNTTYMCKISQQLATIYAEKGTGTGTDRREGGLCRERNILT